MTLGEVKAEALRLMQIDEDVDGDTVAAMADSEDYRLFYKGMPGAINRALADLEARRILPLKRVVLYEPQQAITPPVGGDTSSVAGGRAVPYEVRGNRARFMTDLPDMAAPARVVVEGDHGCDDNYPYRFEAGVLTIADFDATATFELLYHPRIVRVRADTPNATELALPEALAAALPYYLKADLYRVDEPGEANDARNWYEAAVAQYAATLTDGVQNTVETVYGGCFW